MYEMILLIILRPILVIEYKCYLKNMQNMQNEISFSKTTLEIAACSTCYSTINRQDRKTNSFVCRYVFNFVCWPGLEGKKVRFLKSEKIGEKK